MSLDRAYGMIEIVFPKGRILYSNLGQNLFKIHSIELDNCVMKLNEVHKIAFGPRHLSQTKVEGA